MKNLSSHTIQMHKYLVKAIYTQLLICGVCVTTPVVVLLLVSLLKLEYGNEIVMIGSWLLLFYSIGDILALLYFIKPYRMYVKKLLNLRGYLSPPNNQVAPKTVTNIVVVTRKTIG